MENSTYFALTTAFFSTYALAIGIDVFNKPILDSINPSGGVNQSYERYREGCVRNLRYDFGNPGHNG